MMMARVAPVAQQQAGAAANRTSLPDPADRTRRNSLAISPQQLQLQKKSFKSLLVYLLFLVNFCLVTFPGRNERVFFFTQHIRNAVHTSNFGQITSVEQWYDWAGHSLLPGLLGGELNDFTKQSPVTMIGGLRIRQVRVRPNQCVVDDIFQQFTRHCFNDYANYVGNNEDTSPFGPDSSYMFKTAEEIDEPVAYGRVAEYSGGGFLVTNTSKSLEDMQLLMAQLQEANWIDERTRAIFVDFTIYNANLQRFCAARMLTEFTSAGAVLPTSNFRTVQFWRYAAQATPNWGGGQLTLAFEILFVLFVLGFISAEVVECQKKGFAYLDNGWNLLDIVNLSIFVIVIGMSLVVTLRESYLWDELQNVDHDGGGHVNFNKVAFWSNMIYSVTAFNAFLTWMKLFKFLNVVFPHLSLLSRTLSNATQSITAFLLMFLIVFIATGQAFFMAFGLDLQQYRTFMTSVETNFLSVLGEFDYYALYNSNRVLGPLLFWLYMLLVFFVLLNIIIAIISDAYNTALDEVGGVKGMGQMGVFSTVVGLFSEVSKDLHKFFLRNSYIADDVKMTEKDLKRAFEKKEKKEELGELTRTRVVKAEKELTNLVKQMDSISQAMEKIVDLCSKDK